MAKIEHDFTKEELDLLIESWGGIMEFWQFDGDDYEMWCVLDEVFHNTLDKENGTKK